MAPGSSQTETTAARRTALPLAGAVVLFLALMFFAGNLRSGMLGSGLFDPDTYERLLRVEHLLSTHDWYDTSTPWADAPPGGELHWTRPLDLFVGAFAVPLSWNHPLREAVVRGGSLVPVVLGILLVGILSWAARPFVAWRGILLIGVAVGAQQALAHLFRYSYVDHHCLIAVLVALGWGGVVRTFTDHSPHRGALIAGIAAGAGVWVTIESLSWIAAVSAALALLWVMEGDERHVTTLRKMFAAAAVTGAVALVLERPPAQWLANEMDRISLAHVAFLAAIAVSWSLAARARTARATSPGSRFLHCVVLFVVPVALVIALFPKFLRGPVADVDARSIPLLFEGNAEFTPFSTGEQLYLASFAGAIIPVLIACGWSLLVLWRNGEPRLRRLAVMTLSFAAFFVPLMLYQWRWITHVQLASALPWVLAIRQAWLMGTGSDSPLRFLRVPLAVALAVAHVVVALAMFPREMLPSRVKAQQREAAARSGGVRRDDPKPARSAAVSMGQCNFRGLGTLMSRASGTPQRDILVLAPFFEGPQIAFQTGVRVISGPYHRNGPGIVDTVNALTGPDENESRRIIERRGVDFILLCPTGGPTRALASTDRRGLAARLLRRDTPAWLVRVPLPRGADRRARLWRVVTPAG